MGLEDSVAYSVTKSVIWFGLFFAAGIDWIIYRNELAQGWQLHRAIFGCLSIFVVRDVSWSIYIALHNTDVLKWTVMMKLFFHIAEAAFMLLLMLISSGWKTTRSTLGRRLRFMVLAPFALLYSSVINDYLVLKERQAHKNAPPESDGALLSGRETFVLEIMAATSIISFIMIWLWIYQAVKIEEGTLMAKISGISLANTEDPLTGEQLETDLEETDGRPVTAERNETPFPSTPPPTLRVRPLNTMDFAVAREEDDAAEQVGTDKDGAGADLGGSDTPPAADTFQVGPPSPSSYSVGKQDGDDRDRSLMQMPLKAKLRMAVRLRWAVTVYIAMLLIKTLYVAFKTRNSDALMLLADIVLLSLMVFLLWSYRLRRRNLYYMLDDYEDEEDEEGDSHIDGHAKGVPIGNRNLYDDDTTDGGDEDNTTDGGDENVYVAPNNDEDADFEVATFNLND